MVCGHHRSIDCVIHRGNVHHAGGVSDTFDGHIH